MNARVLLLGVLLSLAACGGGGGADGGGDAPPPAPAPTPPPPPPPAATYTVGGTVTGLQGSGLVLRNGGVDLPIAASGNFTFAAGLTTGASYDVTVQTQPSQPTQVCTVTGGQGQVQSANVTSVQVQCREVLALVSTSPVNGTQEITRSIQPTLTFSAPLASATVVPGLATLNSAAGDEVISLSATGAVLSVVPSRPLLPLTDYTLTVANSLQSTGGATLATPVTLNFRTREGAWGTQELVSGSDAATGGPFADASLIVTDDARRVTVVWRSGGQLWSRQRPDGGAWGTPQRLDDAGADEIGDMALASGGDSPGALLRLPDGRIVIAGDVYNGSNNRLGLVQVVP